MMILESGERMKLEEILAITEAELVCGTLDDREIVQAFSSDLMSDVLTVEADDAVLITGLANIQAIRTAEMADISCILFVRDKEITPNMIRLADESGIIIMKTRNAMFTACGNLFREGLKAVY